MKKFKIRVNSSIKEAGITDNVKNAAQELGDVYSGEQQSGTELGNKMSNAAGAVSTAAGKTARSFGQDLKQAGKAVAMTPGVGGPIGGLVSGLSSFFGSGKSQQPQNANPIPDPMGDLTNKVTAMEERIAQLEQELTNQRAANKTQATGPSTGPNTKPNKNAAVTQGGPTPQPMQSLPQPMQSRPPGK